MKKRTACFGWTKKFQRRIAHANSLTNIAGTLDNKAALIESDPKRRSVTDPKPIRDAAQTLYKQARGIVASVKSDHRRRVDLLDGVA